MSGIRPKDRSLVARMAGNIIDPPRAIDPYRAQFEAEQVTAAVNMAIAILAEVDSRVVVTEK